MYGWISYEEYQKIKKHFKVACAVLGVMLAALIVVGSLLVFQVVGAGFSASSESDIAYLQRSNKLLTMENEELTEQLMTEREILINHLASVTATIDNMGILNDMLDDANAELYIKNMALFEYADELEFLQEILSAGYNSARVDFENLRVLSNATEEQLNQILQGSPLADHGWYFLEAERNYTVNALVLIGIIRKESALGRLPAAPNNIAGIRSTAGGWASFESMVACINFLARLLDQRYLTTGAAFYNGVHIEGVNVRYALNPGGAPNWDWSSGIRSSVARDLRVIG